MRYAIIYWLTIIVLFFSQTYAVTKEDLPHIPIEHEQLPPNSSRDSAIIDNSIHNSQYDYWYREASLEENTLTWVASYYDYSLDWLWERSLSHSTCAFHHQKKTYKMYRVTNLDNWKSVDCYNNDYMVRPDRLVDLSSHAFRQIGSTRAWLLHVSVEPIE